MNTAETTNTTRSSLTHDLLLGPDLRRDRYRSGRDRIVANVLYFLPWLVGYFGWDRVREAAGTANATTVLAPVAIVLVVLATAACLVALRRYCVYPAAGAAAAAADG